MSAWRRRGLEAVPECREAIAQAWSPTAMWIELRIRFAAAVTAGDLGLARRILALARDDLAAPSGEVATAAAVAFVEHLADEEPVRARLPELISAQDLRDWRSLIAASAGEEVVAVLEERACREHGGRRTTRR